MCQELELDDGIYCEKATKDTSKYKYTKDNLSYKLGKVFIYDYYYQDKTGKRFKFFLTESASESTTMAFTPFESKAFDVISRIKYKVDDNDMMVKEIPDYTQTTLSVFYLRPNGKNKDSLCEMFGDDSTIPCFDEAMGVIDNKMNLWIHPPRNYTFKILQFCPFPFYNLNTETKKWEWTLETGGSHYFDEKWIDPKGLESIEMKYSYQREKDEVIETPLGVMSCKVAKASGTCKTLPVKTGLKLYYEKNLGFVRLEYDLINGDKMVIWLEQVK